MASISRSGGDASEPGLLHGVIGTAQPRHGARESIQFAPPRGEAVGAMHFDDHFLVHRFPQEQESPWSACCLRISSRLRRRDQPAGSESR